MNQKGSIIEMIIFILKNPLLYSYRYKVEVCLSAGYKHSPPPTLLYLKYSPKPHHSGIKRFISCILCLCLLH